MKRNASLLAAAAAIVPVMWAAVAPSGLAICTSDTAFNYHPLDEAGEKAGKLAKTQLCKVVLQ